MDFRVYKGDLDPDFKIFSDITSENTVSPMHINYYAEIVLCLEGKLRLNVGENERILQAGETSFIHPLEVHSFNSGKNKTRVFCFSPLIFDDLLRQTPISNHSAGKISAPCLSYIEYLTGKPLSFPENEHEIRLILGSLMFETPRTAPCTEQSLAICRAMTWMEEHYTEKIYLGQLAKAIGVNRFYACQMFPKYLNGATFTQVLNKMRMHRALKILPYKPISHAALESGFGSIRQFNRVFHELTGSVPRDYRNLTNYTENEKHRIF